MIRPEHEQRLYEYMSGIADHEIGSAIKIGGVADHLHTLLSLNTDVSVAHAMNRLKSLSSGWLKRTFPALSDFAWQAGYGAFSVSRSNQDQVARYIANQKEHHRRMQFREEFAAFLQRHGIAFDPAQL